MSNINQKHPWVNYSSNSILKQPFLELIDIGKWNEEMEPFYKRVNKTKDERAFVILMTLVVEFHIDAIFKVFFPKSKDLLENISFTLSLKISVLKSLNLLPDQIFKFIDLIRKIRNEFAHRIEIDSIKQLNTSQKGKKLIQQLNKLCDDYSESMTYSKYSPDNLREKFKDISNIVNNALREYEPSVLLIRNEIEKKEFLDKILKENEFKII